MESFNLFIKARIRVGVQPVLWGLITCTFNWFSNAGIKYGHFKGSYIMALKG